MPSMTFARRFAAACGLVALATGPSAAGPDPSPANSIVPCAIVVVPAPAATAAHEFEVVHRNLASNPIPGAMLVIDFSGFGGDVRVAHQQRPGATADCPGQSVSQVTDAQGRAVFRIIGGSSGGACAAHGRCARVFADGVLLTSIGAAVLDLDGRAGLGAADLSLSRSGRNVRRAALRTVAIGPPAPATREEAPRDRSAAGRSRFS